MCESQMSIHKGKRVPLTEEMKLFLLQSPVILVPTLKIKEILKTPLSKTKKCIIQSKRPRLQDKLPKTKDRESLEVARDEDPCTTSNSLAANSKLQTVGSSAKQPVPPTSPIQQKCDEQGPASPSVNDAKSPSKVTETSLTGTDVGENSLNKALLLSTLNLVEQTQSRGVQAAKESQLPTELRNKFLSKRGQVVNYFKSNPLPISSTLGTKIIRSGFGKCPNPTAEVTRYEKYCTTHEPQRYPRAAVTRWPVVNTRRAVLKRGQYFHKYTFGTHQRVTRKVELTLGISAKGFPLLNKCRDFSIHAHKMSDQDIVQAIYSLQNSPQGQASRDTTTESSPPVRRWIASEPTAGPSRDIEIIAEPVVLLHDISFALSCAHYNS